MNLNLRNTDFEDMVLQDGVWIPSGNFFDPAEMFKEPKPQQSWVGDWDVKDDSYRYYTQHRYYTHFDGNKSSVDQALKDWLNKNRYK